MDKSLNEEFKDYFETICEISPVGLFRTDNNGDMVYLNKRCESLTGNKVEELKGEGWLQHIHLQDINKVIKKWKESVKKRVKFSIEFRLSQKGGKIIWVLGQATPINGNSGFVGSFTNINKRKKILNELMSLRESV